MLTSSCYPCYTYYIYICYKPCNAFYFFGGVIFYILFFWICFYLSLLLVELLIGYRIFGWQFFSLSTFKIMFFLLPSYFWGEVIHFLYEMWCLSLVAFQIFFVFGVICFAHDVLVYFCFVLFILSSWIWKSLFFNTFGKILSIISSDIFLPYFHSFLVGIQL